jgi:hypothetical protein
MTRTWWPLGCAVACLLCVTVSPAAAQTFIVRNAPAGGSLEVSFGSATGKGSVDQSGSGTVRLTNSPVTEGEASAAVFADTCGTTVRLVLVGRTAEPPAAASGCQRRAVPGYFVFRDETSLVVDLAPSVPIVRIRQGRVPSAWLMDGPISTGRQPPRGLVGYGGGGFGGAEETVDLTCGNTSPCTRESTKLSFLGGASYWLTPWLGIDGAFVKPTAFKTEGLGDDYEQVSEFTPRVLAVSVLGGWPVGPARFYGRLGGGYHKARVETTQATFLRTITVDGVTITYPSSTQEFVYETEGWGRVLGGGVEGWVSDRASMFAEAWWVRLEGEEANTGGDRVMKDRLRTILVGVKIHVGRRR